MVNDFPTMALETGVTEIQSTSGTALTVTLACSDNCRSCPSGLATNSLVVITSAFFSGSGSFTFSVQASSAGGRSHKR